MSVRMRVTRAHTGNRRSHHALKEPRLSTCAKCNAQHLRHRMCPQCGNYRGREVVNVAAKQEARMKRREEKNRAFGEGTANENEKEAKAAVAEEREDKKTKKTAKKKSSEE